MAREKMITFTNNKNEIVEVEFFSCEYSGPHSLPKLWEKAGYVSEIFDRYLWADVYATDENGNTWNKYNPQQKKAEDGARMVLDFEWVREDTEENRKALLVEIVRRAMA